MSDKHLILAFFADESAADIAATTLKDSGTAEGDAIGVMALDPSGNLAVEKVGATSVAAGVGVGVGACLFILGPAFLGYGAATAIVGGGVGMAGGAVGGSMHHKGLKLSDGQGKDRRGPQRRPGRGRCPGTYRSGGRGPGQAHRAGRNNDCPRSCG